MSETFIARLDKALVKYTAGDNFTLAEGQSRYMDLKLSRSEKNLREPFSDKKYDSDKTKNTLLNCVDFAAHYCKEKKKGSVILRPYLNKEFHFFHQKFLYPVSVLPSETEIKINEKYFQ